MYLWVCIYADRLAGGRCTDVGAGCRRDGGGAGGGGWRRANRCGGGGGGCWNPRRRFGYDVVGLGPPVRYVYVVVLRRCRVLVDEPFPFKFEPDVLDGACII